MAMFSAVQHLCWTECINHAPLSSAAVTEILLQRMPVCAGNFDSVSPTVQCSA